MDFSNNIFVIGVILTSEGERTDFKLLLCSRGRTTNTFFSENFYFLVANIFWASKSYSTVPKYVVYQSAIYLNFVIYLLIWEKRCYTTELQGVGCL